jgi:uncharacterized protein (DUF4415 family)
MTIPVAPSEIERTNPFQLAAAKTEKRAPLEIRPAGAIESSDIPPPGDAMAKNAAFNPLYRPKKTSTTVRIDSDVLLWLRAHGKGYQSRMNSILRRAMIASLNSTEAE